MMLEVVRSAVVVDVVVTWPGVVAIVLVVTGGWVELNVGREVLLVFSAVMVEVVRSAVVVSVSMTWPGVVTVVLVVTGGCVRLEVGRLVPLV